MLRYTLGLSPLAIVLPPVLASISIDHKPKGKRWREINQRQDTAIGDPTNEEIPPSSSLDSFAEDDNAPLQSSTLVSSVPTDISPDSPTEENLSNHVEQPTPTTRPSSDSTANEGIQLLTDTKPQNTHVSTTFDSSSNATDTSKPFMSNKPVVAVLFTLVAASILSLILFGAFYVYKRSRRRQESLMWDEVKYTRRFPGMTSQSGSSIYMSSTEFYPSYSKLTLAPPLPQPLYPNASLSSRVRETLPQGCSNSAMTSTSQNSRGSLREPTRWSGNEKGDNELTGVGDRLSALNIWAPQSRRDHLPSNSSIGLDKDTFSDREFVDVTSESWVGGEEEAQIATLDIDAFGRKFSFVDISAFPDPPE